MEFEKTIFGGKISGSEIQKWQEKVESNEEEVKEIICKSLLESSFEQFLENTEIESSAIIGLISKSLANVIGGKNQIVLFSSYTAKKEKHKHKDITIDHFLGIQKLFDEGQVIKDNRPQYTVHLLFFKKIDDKYLKACVKATKEGDELYLQTLHFISEKQLAIFQERGLILRDFKTEKQRIRMFLAEYIHK